MSLVDAVKEFRSKIHQRDSTGITAQKVNWNLLPSFIGRPINQQTTKELSTYVDQQLLKYSAIYGTEAAINSPTATAIPDDIDSSKLQVEEGVKYTTLNTTQQPVHREIFLPERPIYEDEHNAATGIYNPETGKHEREKDYFGRERSIKKVHRGYKIGDTTGKNYLALRIPRHDVNKTGKISYVTSYTIDHSGSSIEARIVTAPSAEQIDNAIWNDLCDNDGKGPETLSDVVSNTVKANLAILIKNRNQIPEFESKADRVAAETLREMISERDFRKYLKYGFVIARGQSDRIYQIFNNNQHIKVWKSGKLIEEICVYLKNANIPKTDKIIAFKTAIEADENEFKKLGNVYPRSKAA